jgi:G:T-mismatch repair DNA endonuclease (very short patch repair protein)
MSDLRNREALRVINTGAGNPMFGKHPSEETTKKRLIARAGYVHTKETREKIRVGNEGKKYSKESREKMRRSAIGRFCSEETKEKLREITKQLWQDTEYSKKTLVGLDMHPNKPETYLFNLLQELCPNLFKLNVCGEVAIINGKIPDFVCEEKKLLIELFGDYWHSEKCSKRNNQKHVTPEERINLFKPFGYRTLVIWEKELGDLPSLQTRISSFVEF